MSTSRCVLFLSCLLLSTFGIAQPIRPLAQSAQYGPLVTRTDPSKWDKIEEDQVFILEFDKTPTTANLSKMFSFYTEGIAEPNAAQLLAANEIAKLVKANRVNKDAYENKRLIFIKPTRKFPNKTTVKLVIAKGFSANDQTKTTSEQILEWESVDAFNATVNCERENEDLGCLPLRNIMLNFTGHVPIKFLKEIYLLAPDKKKIYSTIDTTSQTAKHLAFPTPFVPNEKYTFVLPEGLKDERGRVLQNAQRFPLTFQIGEFPSLAKFSGVFGVVEATDPVLPVTVRNIEGTIEASVLSISPQDLFERPKQILDWFYLEKEFQEKSRDESFLNQKVDVSKQKNFSLKKPNPKTQLEVIGIPLKKTGLHITEIKSQILGQKLLHSKKPMFVHSMTLATDLSAHLKFTDSEALVWVTRLSTGKPVAKAQVKVVDCKGMNLPTKQTDEWGVAQFSITKISNCKTAAMFYEGVLAVAKHGNDTSFTFPTWTKGIESWQFRAGRSDYGNRAERIVTILDRTLLRTGETLHMKHIARFIDTEGLRSLNKEKFPKKFVARFIGNDDVFPIPLKWNESGEAVAEWKIPQHVPLGSYDLCFEFIDWPESCTARFRVGDFRVPNTKAILKTSAKPLINPKQIPLEIALEHLSGGHAGKQTVVVRSQNIYTHYLSNENFPQFNFAAGDYPLQVPKSDSASNDEKSISSKSVELGANGTASTFISVNHSSNTPFETKIDVEYLDSNGETQTASTSQIVYPSKRLVGIKLIDIKNEPSVRNLEVAVLSHEFKPLANEDIEIEAIHEIHYSARKRIAGGFYSYESSEERKSLGLVCKGKTAENGLFKCTARPKVTGKIVFVARLMSSGDKKSASWTYSYFYKGTKSWFPVADSDRIDIISDKKIYEHGETAKLQVQAPFPEATALVTIERNGFIKSFVRAWHSASPVIEIPLEENFLPNVLVSVMLVRGRVAAPAADAVIDLAKPGFKIGYAEILVAPKNAILNVHVTPEKSIYQVRDKVRVRVKVTDNKGSVPKNIGKLSLAVVDDGLLQISPNPTWKPVESFLRAFPHTVTTASAQLHVVGKRHFGVKSVPNGGGGGLGPTRELFDTLISWQPSISLNEKGEADVSFTLNDSLTSFTIAAFATAGWNKIGSGESNIRATQDVMIISGLAPVAREGDTFFASFTVRNTTNQSKHLNLQFSTQPKIEGTFATRKLDLAPHEERRVSWPISLNKNFADEQSSQLNYLIEATAGNKVVDRIKIKQEVLSVKQKQITQASLGRVETKGTTLTLQKTVVGKNEIDVQFYKSLSHIAGVEDYMKNYPYSCLEQRLSRAVALNDKSLWQITMRELTKYFDNDGLLMYYPGMISGDVSLTAFVLTIANASEFKIPSEHSHRLSSALTKNLKKGRNDKPLSVTQKLMVLNALSQTYLSADIAKHLSFDPHQLSNTALVHWLAVLAQSSVIPDRAAKLAATENVLRSRLVGNGTFIAFAPGPQDKLLNSFDPFEDAILNEPILLFTLLNIDFWKDYPAKLIFGRFSNPKNSHWGNTIANAYGSVATRLFAKKFEDKNAVSGKTIITADAVKKELNWPKKEDTSPRVVLPANLSEKNASLSITHKGPGFPWFTVLTSVTHKISSFYDSGLRIEREVFPIEQRKKGGWSVGDLGYVKLKIKGNVARPWVVVEDPIPAGAMVVTGGLARSLAKPFQENENQPTFTESSLKFLRASFERHETTPTSFGYVIRYNQAGQFELPATHAEAMYTPEFSGDRPNEVITVAP